MQTDHTHTHTHTHTRTRTRTHTHTHTNNQFRFRITKDIKFYSLYFLYMLKIEVREKNVYFCTEHSREERLTRTNANTYTHKQKPFKLAEQKQRETMKYVIINKMFNKAIYYYYVMAKCCRHIIGVEYNIHQSG